MFVRRATLLMLLPAASIAAPYAYTNVYPVATDPKVPTHCGVYVNTAAKVEIAVTTDTTGTYCLYDLATLPVGNNTVKVSYIRKDTLWGTVEGDPSVPLSLTRPGKPVAPTSLQAKP